MGTFSDLFNDVWRDFQTAGVPSSGDYDPAKYYIRSIGAILDGAIAAAIQGMPQFATLALAQAGPAVAPGSQAHVFNDPTPANDGIYVNPTGAVGGYVFDSAFYAQVATYVQPLVDLARNWASQASGPVDNVNYPGKLSALAYSLVAQGYANTAALGADPVTANALARSAVVKWVPGPGYYIGDASGNYISKADGTQSIDLTALGDLATTSAQKLNSIAKWAPGQAAYEGDGAGNYTFKVDQTGSGITTKPTIYLLMGFGQSWTLGNPNAVTTSKGLANLSMFNGGVIPMGAFTSITSVIDPTTIQTIVPLAADTTINREVYVAGAAEWLNANVGANVIACAIGVGGQVYNNLKKGTVPWSNMLACVSAAQAYAASQGAQLQVVMLWEQMQANYTDPTATYTGDLNDLINNANVDIPAITGQSQVQIFASQCPSLSQSYPPIALWNVSKTSPLMHLIGPTYDLPLLDAQHPTGIGYHHLGLEYARAIKRVIFDKLPWKPFQPVSATLSGSAITVLMEGQTGVPQIDTVGVADRGPGKGFEFFDDSGATPAITGVAATLTGYTITLASAPTGTAASRLLDTAWTSTTTPTGTTNAPAGATGSLPGARTNLCDQDGLTDTAAGTTFTQPKRCVISQLAVN